MRIGQGYDAHRFGDGDRIVVGGVEVPHTQGVVAYSDGDVLVHAVCDALLGAGALGDIGGHFPDSAGEFANIDSRVLLRRVVEMLSDLKFDVANIDATIIAQLPKFAPYIKQMRSNIASDCGIETAQVSVKATTTEGMGFTGRQEGIAAQAVVLIRAAQ